MSDVRTVTPESLREWPLPQPGDSKHDRGHVAVLGGARRTPGAVLLTGLGALRVGAGVLAMAVPDEVAVPLAVEVPEASVTGWRADSPDWTVLDDLLEQASAVVVGPGLDDGDIAASLVTYVARFDASWPVLLDAYALGALADADDATALANRLVLTPNREEARRLLPGTDEPPDDDAEVARCVAQKWHATVSLYNTIALPDHDVVRHIPGERPGLGTSGSGDVLAGAIAGLLARGADLEQATVWGTYLHCAASDRLTERIGPLGYLARELLDEVPLALSELTS
jgi:hydroxyethylthiazole kinase-like uncharacterized protein yjeF